MTVGQRAGGENLLCEALLLFRLSIADEWTGKSSRLICWNAGVMPEYRTQRLTTEEANKRC